VRIDDERDLHERLEEAFEAISPLPAPVDDTVRRGRAIRGRRVAVVVGAGVVAATAALAVPSLLHPTAAPAPAAPTKSFTVTVQAPGPGAQPDLIASGTINGQRWWVVADRPGVDGAGAGQEDIIIAGPAVEAIDGTVPVVPVLSTAHSLGPVSFTTTTSGAAQVQVGAVQADVSYVTVRFGNGSVLTLHPVTVYGTRAVAFASPEGAQITDVVAYSAHGEIASAVPFNQPGGWAWFVSWLRPGQHQAGRVSGRIASGTAGGTAWSATAYLGPWGTCMLVTNPQLNGVACVPSVSGPAVVLMLDQGGTPEIAGGVLSASVARVVVTQPDGSTVQVRLVRVGGHKFLAFAVRPGAKPLRWVAYDSAGKVVASSAR
jgi:hypothetical protein